MRPGADSQQPELHICVALILILFNVNVVFTLCCRDTGVESFTPINVASKLFDSKQDVFLSLAKHYTNQTDIFLVLI